MSDFVFTLDRPKSSIRKAELLEDLQRFKAQLKSNEAVTAKHFKNWRGRKYSYSSYTRVFESWKKICDMLEINQGQAHRYDESFLLEHIEKVWRWREAPPSGLDLKKYNSVHGTTVSQDAYSRRWGSFVMFKELFVKYKNGALTKDELISEAKKEKRNPRDVSTQKKWKVLDRDNKTCQLCGAKAPDVMLHVHHVIPLAQGGDNSEENLQTRCADCNLGQGSLLPTQEQ